MALLGAVLAQLLTALVELLFQPGHSVTSGANGTAVLNSDGTVTFTPNTNYNGPADFTYTVTDGLLTSSPATVTLTVVAVNDAPTATDDSGAVNEAATLNVSAANGVILGAGAGAGTDTDPDGDTLVVSQVNGQAANVGTAITGTYGDLTLNANGDYTYVANNANGIANGATVTDTFTYTVSDGQGGTDTAQLVLNVTGTNDAPIANNISFDAVQAGDAIVITLTGSDADSGDSIEGFRITSLPPQGELRLNGVVISNNSSVSAADIADGKLTYMPNNTFDSEHGAPAPSFTYEAFDGEGYSVPATATVNVADVGPTAVDDSITVTEGSVQGTVNLVLVLDTSGSMGIGSSSTSKLGIAKAALQNLIDQYGDAVLQVKIVSFNDAAKAEGAGWLSASEAKTVIGSISGSSNGTDYDDALDFVQSNYGTPTAADATYVYFLSDGQPTGSEGGDSNAISATERSVWTEFLAAKNIDAAYAVGITITGDADKTQLDSVAWSPDGNPAMTWNSGIPVTSNAHNVNTVVVNDANDLADALTNTVTTSVTGNLLTGIIVNNEDTFGADGAGVQKIVGLGLDTDGDGNVDVAATLNAGTYAIDLGATIGNLTLNANTGEFSFNPVSGYDIGSDQSFKLIYTIADKDGSTDDGVLTLNLKDASDVNAYDNYAQAQLPSTSTVNDFSVTDARNSGTQVATTGESSSFTVTAGSATLTFDAVRTGQLAGNYFRDSFQYKLSNESGWQTLNSGSNSIIINSNGTYTLQVRVTDNANNFLNANADISNLQLQQQHIAKGNVITDANHFVGSNDLWGAVDSLGSEGAELTAVNGTELTVVNGASLKTLSITGTHGDLLIAADGSYTYTPHTNASVGATDTFSYTLTQHDGSSDSANLVIKISDTSYTVPTPISGNGTNLVGTSGDDVMIAGNGDNTLSAGNGNDHLEGGAGNDQLLGEEGNDILIGGAGNDTLTGGNGVDQFVWHAGNTGNDKITDFNLADKDRIDLHDLLQGETDATIGNFLQMVTSGGSSTLLVSSTGHLNDAGGAAANADVSIKLDNLDLSNTTINSLIAGVDPTIKVDHS